MNDVIKHKLANGEFVFETHCKGLIEGDGGIVFEPSTLRWIPEFCSGKRLLDECPAVETLAAAKELAAKVGGEVSLTRLEHVAACGASGTEVAAKYQAAHNWLASN